MLTSSGLECSHRFQRAGTGLDASDAAWLEGSLVEGFPGVAPGRASGAPGAWDGSGGSNEDMTVSSRSGDNFGSAPSTEGSTTAITSAKDLCVRKPARGWRVLEAHLITDPIASHRSGRGDVLHVGSRQSAPPRGAWDLEAELGCTICAVRVKPLARPTRLCNDAIRRVWPTGSEVL